MCVCVWGFFYVGFVECGGEWILNIDSPLQRGERAWCSVKCVCFLLIVKPCLFLMNFSTSVSNYAHLNRGISLYFRTLVTVSTAFSFFFLYIRGWTDLNLESHGY